MSTTSTNMTGHIRPKRNKKAASAAKPAAAPIKEEDVEEVRLKMESWMGIGGSQKKKVANASETVVPSTITTTVEVPSSSSVGGGETRGEESAAAGRSIISDTTPEAAPTPPRSILKKPKYSKPKDNETPTPPQTTQPKKSIFKQDCIQERHPTKTTTTKPPKIQLQNPKEAAMAVEGYQPKMDHNKRINTSKTNEMEEESDEPLVFNSLTDMMEMAGSLPDQDLHNNPQVLEAELAFTCMAPDEYQAGLILQGMEQQEAEFDEQQDDKTPEWKQPAPKPKLDMDYNAEEEAGANTDATDDEDDDDDGSEIDNVFFDLLGQDSEEEEDEPVAIAPPRAFRALWECLSPLITPDSCGYLRRLQREHQQGTASTLMTPPPLHDLEASRANGFLTMLRMYLSKALKELNQPVEQRRTAEHRLQGLLHTFDFSRPAAKLETKQWRALTCILLEMVLFLDAQHLPASAMAADMTLDEYRYLVQNTIRTFDIPDPVI